VEELTGLLLPIAFLAVLYLLLIRPQQKRRKEQEHMVRTLEVGDDVVTIGGLHGRVVALSDTAMDIAVDADEDVIVRYERSALGRIVTDEPVTSDEALTEDEDDEA
jgi:preprotein translocase subunit YajC